MGSSPISATRLKESSMAESNRKLDESQRKKVMELRKLGFSWAALGRRFGVAPVTLQMALDPEAREKDLVKGRRAYAKRKEKTGEVYSGERSTKNRTASGRFASRNESDSGQEKEATQA